MINTEYCSVCAPSPPSPSDVRSEFIITGIHATANVVDAGVKGVTSGLSMFGKMLGGGKKNSTGSDEGMAI